jgi:hypothetical protein
MSLVIPLAASLLIWAWEYARTRLGERRTAAPA